ncbi:EAL domain-containing protein [Massilia sp. PAMC28688]|uniref:EAL domain-containing protein n=1 Tax=Massilia sp. PAMC28688 TaxID=2861283 RepID=UPI001C636705|nr:EAL domain-containing protein [Massilia sp. PAMC28688]QYF92131.1 EAL domain-containing protein [Massilia sp. PAMC28688]
MMAVQEEDDLLAYAAVAPWESRAGTSVVLSAGGALMAGLDGPGTQSLADFMALVHPGDRARLAEYLGSEARAGHFSVSFRVCPGTAGPRWLTLRGSVLDATGGELPLIRGLIGERADQIHTDTIAARTLKAIDEGILTSDASGRITYINPAGEALTGCAGHQILGLMVDRALHFVHPDGSPEFECAVQRCLRLRQTVTRAADCILSTCDGRRLVIEEAASPIMGADGQVTGAVMVFRDVSHERHLRQQLSWRATHDALTGLLNRAEFEAQLASACQSAAADDHLHALLFMDLDRFKIVNDTCGHGAGDQLLQMLTRLLLAHLRESDVLARLGGDELGLLLLHCPMDKAEHVANNLRQAVRDFRFQWEEHVFQLGISIGIAGIVPDGCPARDIMSRADQACYAAKQAGRDCVRIYEPSAAERAAHAGKAAWMAKLRSAFEHERFRLYTMPIRRLSAPGDGNGEGGHEEILVRMSTESDGVLLPGAFLPAAERHEMMTAIDRWVIDALCRYMHQQQLADPGWGALCSVNLSPASMSEPGMARFVADCFARHAVTPSMFCIEIDESAMAAAPHAARELVQELRGSGCRFTLDNFGGAMSSFATLKQVPVDFLKIDGMLVRGSASDPMCRVMVRAISDVAHTMGMQTVAGHVENDDILHALDDLGIDFVQGYAIGQAQPLPERRYLMH